MGLFVNLASLSTLVLAVQAFSPTGGYAPGNITCPSSTTAGDSLNFVRAATSISDSESDWLELRHNITDQALKEFLERADLDDFDVDDFFDSLNSSINIGLAFSGGGYRAMLCGAGQISGLDSRTSGANEHGLGGLLQASTYLAGLSGGNWLTGTLALNNWTSVESILAQDDIWDLSTTIFASGGWNIFKTAGRWDDISDAIEAKQNAGFNTSITDIWGRALSYQFFGSDNDNGGEGLTFSSIRDFAVFKNASMPFPLSVANGRTPGTTIINSNSTVFEMNPFELGSWDPSLYAFTDIKYLGTNVSDGAPTDDTCIAGFDNAGFVMGTSSSLFNQFLLQLNTTGLSGVVYDIIEDFLENLSEDYDDVAIYDPNPFYNTKYASVETIAESDYLYLVDGGEDLQNVPYAPLVQPERKVDIIFSFDNSADTDDNLPNGASAVETYARQFSTQANGTSFPYVPGQDSFLHYNLTTRPTFFGCDTTNLTDLSVIPPLVVYIPNTPYSYWSNTSTYKMKYSSDEKKSMIKNGFEVSSRYNLTIDSNWQKCVSCAIIRREQQRNNQTQSEECQECFSEYCWDGSYTNSLNLTYSNNYTSENNIDSPDESSLTTGLDSQTATADSQSGSSETSVSSTASAGSSSSGSGKSSGIHQYSEPISKLLVASLVAVFAVAFF